MTRRDRETARGYLDALGDSIVESLDSPDAVFHLDDSTIQRIDALLYFKYSCEDPTNVRSVRSDFLHGLRIRLLARQHSSATSPTPQDRLWEFRDAAIANCAQLRQLEGIRRPETIHQLIYIGCGNRNHGASWEVHENVLETLFSGAALRRAAFIRTGIQPILSSTTALFPTATTTNSPSTPLSSRSESDDQFSDNSL
eukprot:GHVU01152706.1.p1 GENE.GHVU01152706.1~~GHVU01152706.1.p1  ORF type:complete len:198 (-),score=7.31 GHVU01152706.1:123-716(-)